MNEDFVTSCKMWVCGPKLCFYNVPYEDAFCWIMKLVRFSMLTFQRTHCTVVVLLMRKIRLINFLPSLFFYMSHSPAYFSAASSEEHMLRKVFSISYSFAWLYFTDIPLHFTTCSSCLSQPSRLHKS